MNRIRFEQGATVLQFPLNMGRPSFRPLEKMQVIDRAADGVTLQVEELGGNLRQWPLRFPALPTWFVAQLENWFDNVANGAMNEFTYYDPDGNDYTVRIISPKFDFPEFEEGWCSGELLMEISP